MYRKIYSHANSIRVMMMMMMIILEPDLKLKQIIKGNKITYVVVVVVSHIQRIDCQPEKLLYTVANPARGLLNREKRTKEKVWQHTYSNLKLSYMLVVFSVPFFTSTCFGGPSWRGSLPRYHTVEPVLLTLGNPIESHETFLKKNLNASKPSEHRSQGENIKTFCPCSQRSHIYLVVVNVLAFPPLTVCVLSPDLLFLTPDLWTHQPGSHRISPPCFCGGCLNFYREKGSAISFPRRP